MLLLWYRYWLKDYLNMNIKGSDLAAYANSAGLQAHFRRYCARKHYKKQLAAAVRIQSYVGGFLSRRQVGIWLQNALTAVQPARAQTAYLLAAGSVAAQYARQCDSPCAVPRVCLYGCRYWAGFKG
jgi:hypothetical protein